jgi:hypothetical protein
MQNPTLRTWILHKKGSRGLVFVKIEHFSMKNQENKEKIKKRGLKIKKMTRY